MLLVAACLVAGAAGGFLAGRATREPSLLQPVTGDGPAIAEFRGWTLPRGAVEEELSALPALVKQQLRSPEAKKAYLEGIVTAELIAREAERRGFQRDPAVARKYKEELARAFLEKEFEAPQRRSAPTDDDVRKLFDENRAALARPERARIATIAFLPDGDGQRAAKRGLAERALSDLLRAKDPYAFSNAARTGSDDILARATNGELPVATREDLAKRVGPEVAEAAFSLGESKVVPRVVETPRGFYLVKLLGREDAYAPAFEEVRDALRARLAAERRAKAYRAFVDALSREAGVRYDEKAIAELRVE
jgi:peptidylprolyl isomerase